MKIAVVGAAGRTGLEIVKQARERNHAVRALTRDAAKFPPELTDVEVVVADVLAPETLDSAVAGVDAVIVSLGGKELNDATTRSEGTQNVVNAMKMNGVQRIIIVSTAGVDESFNQLSEGGQQAVRTVIRVAVEDHSRQEALVRASGLTWTVARPGGLRSEDDRKYVTDSDGKIQINAVNRAALAAFIMDALENPATENSTWGVSGS